MWYKNQVMDPPKTSRRNKEDFVQWKEPSQLVGTDQNKIGRASPVGVRKKKQATREVIVHARIDSRTASETNSAQRSEENSKANREMQAAPPELSPRPPQRLSLLLQLNLCHLDLHQRHHTEKHHKEHPCIYRTKDVTQASHHHADITTGSNCIPKKVCQLKHVAVWTIMQCMRAEEDLQVNNFYSCVVYLSV